MENHELSRAELLLHASSTNGEVPTQKKLAFSDAMSNRLFLYPIDKWSQIKYKIIRMPFYVWCSFLPVYSSDQWPVSPAFYLYPPVVGHSRNARVECGWMMETTLKLSGLPSKHAYIYGEWILGNEHFFLALFMFIPFDGVAKRKKKKNERKICASLAKVSHLKLVKASRTKRMWFTEQKSTRIQRWRARASSKQAPEIKNSDFELTFSIIPFRLAETNSKWALDGQYQNGEHNIHQQFSFFATPTMGMGWDGVWWRMRGERQLWRWSALHSISLFPLNSRTKRSISFRLLPRIMHTGIGNVHNGPLLPISHILSREMSKSESENSTDSQLVVGSSGANGNELSCIRHLWLHPSCAHCRRHPFLTLFIV